jgi:hypothetical protein
MKTKLSYSIVCAALLAVSQTPSLLAQETAAPKSDATMGRVDVAHAQMSAEVTAIDLATRQVTLKGQSGDEVTVTVGDAVKRLDEVKVGDFVQVDYLVSIAAEVRKPTKEEAKHPLEIMAAGGRASKDAAPAAGVARQF